MECVVCGVCACVECVGVCGLCGTVWGGGRVCVWGGGRDQQLAELINRYIQNTFDTLTVKANTTFCYQKFWSNLQLPNYLEYVAIGTEEVEH